MKDDLISRQAAIDMIRLYREDEAVDLDELESSIAMLPSEQPKTQLSTEDTTFDCISRRAAIDAVSKYLEPYAIGETIKTLLWILPSAQPEPDTRLYSDGFGDGYKQALKDAQPEIIRCKDCKYRMPYDWMFSEVWQSQNMDDYSEEEIGCQYCDMSMKSDDFCSRAERRGEQP